LSSHPFKTSLGIARKLGQEDLDGANSGKPSTFWLDCDDGKKRVNGDYFSYLKNEQIAPGAKAGVLLNMVRGIVEFTIDGQRMG